MRRAQMARIDAPEVVANLPRGGYHAGQISDVVGKQQMALGQGFGKVADALFQIEKKEKEEADALRITAAVNELNESCTELMYGVDGVFNQKGNNAINRASGKDLVSEYSEKLSSIAETISSGLTNDQKKIFMMKYGDISGQFRRQATKHLGQEKTRFSLGVIQSGVNASMKSYVQSAIHGDKERSASSFIEVQGYVKQFADYMGLTDEQRAEMEAKTFSRGHRMVIGSMLDRGDWKGAEAYSKDNESTLELPDLDWATSHINEQKWTDQGEAMADRAVRRAGSLDQLQRMADGIENPTVKSAFLSRARSMMSRRRSSEKRVKSLAFEAAYESIANGGRVPVSALDQLSDVQKAELASFQKRRLTGIPDESDDAVVTELRADPNMLASADLLRLHVQGKLSDDDYRLLSESKNQLISNKKKGKAPKVNVRREVKFVLNGLGMDTKDSALLLMVESHVLDEKETLEQSGKVVTQPDVMEIVKRAVTGYYYSSGVGYGKTAPYEMTIDDVPTEERQAIAEALMRRGQTVTKARVIETYLKERAMRG